MDDSSKTTGQSRRIPLYVKGQEHLDATGEYARWSGDEFPHRRSIPDVSRRDMLKLIGAGAAMAGLASGCRFLPERKIVPFVNQPEDYTPGIPRHFATTLALSGYGLGVLVESHEGRPTNVAGNPLHPASRGAVSAYALGELYNLYDPDRLKNPTFKGDPANWDEFLKAVRQALLDAPEGSVAVLTETVGSPTEAAVLTRLEESGIRWFQYEPINRDNRREGAVRAFGRDVEAVPHFDKVKVLLSLDSDFMQYGPAPVAFARDLASTRDVERTGEMSRIYAAECFPTLTGAMADHRLPVKASEIASVALAIASQLGVPGAVAPSLPAGVEEKWIAAAAADLSANRGASLVWVGDHQPAEVHALVHAINERLGAFGQTVRLIDPVLPKPVNQTREITELAEGLRSGRITTLLVLGGNPAFNAPADLGFSELIGKAAFSAHLSLHQDETSNLCQWSLPISHPFEAWGDSVAFDGTVSLVQPLIQPLYDSKAVIEVVDGLLGASRPSRDIVRAYWKAAGLQPAAQAGGADPTAAVPGELETTFDRRWRQALSNGLAKVAEPRASLPLTTTPNLAAAVRPSASTGLELVFLPDSSVYDGRYANSPWMQELPKAITSFTWDNALFLSTATAERLGLERREVIGTRELEIAPLGLGRPMARAKVQGGEVKAAVASQMGQADDTIVFHLGYGRTQGGEWLREPCPKNGGGFNAFALRTTNAPGIVTGVELEKTNDFYSMANVQFHNTIEVEVYDSDREVIRESNLTAFQEGGALYKPKAFFLGKKEVQIDGTVVPHEGKDGKEGHAEGETKKKVAPLTMYDPNKIGTFEEAKETLNQWAMTVDLNLCTGCGVCTIACQVENNIPAVGKNEVKKGREMHWIRVDRYYKGHEGKLDPKNPPIRFQPVACVHCEKAPCEPVCPVAATVHSHEGLNQMVYNRCVGTRYCSNNCPYKVRRFNFLHYTQRVDDIPILSMIQNPDVSVRGRGVMEKCTYCVQRINKVRITAKKEGREIADGEVVTACQAACPSQAIIFGDMRRPENKVAQSRASRRNYILLEEANTKPRTTYLMRVNNPNPELEA